MPGEFLFYAPSRVGRYRGQQPVEPLWAPKEPERDEPIFGIHQIDPIVMQLAGILPAWNS
jgi:hypothetical protein